MWNRPNDRSFYTAILKISIDAIHSRLVCVEFVGAVLIYQINWLAEEQEKNKKNKKQIKKQEKNENGRIRANVVYAP